MARAKSDLIDQYLDVLWDRKASDLLLTAGAPPLLRIDGTMTPMAGVAALLPEEIERMVLGILSEDMAARFQADGSFEGRIFLRTSSAGAREVSVRVKWDRPEK